MTAQSKVMLQPTLYKLEVFQKGTDDPSQVGYSTVHGQSELAAMLLSWQIKLFYKPEDNAPSSSVIETAKTNCLRCFLSIFLTTLLTAPNFRADQMPTFRKTTSLIRKPQYTSADDW